MSTVDPKKIAAFQDTLFHDVVFPSVLGGPVTLTRPIAPAFALSMDASFRPSDIDRFAHFQLARVRLARSIVPLDVVDEMGEHDWSLFACFHNLLYLSFPALHGSFRKAPFDRTLSACWTILKGIPTPSSLREAILRHTLFSRTLSITRTDTRVKWWTGSETFLGSEPSKRLLAWPGARRVRVEKNEVPLPALYPPDTGDKQEHVMNAWASFIERSPLTNLATLPRAYPTPSLDVWSLAALESAEGRTIVQRVTTGVPFETLLEHFARFVNAPSFRREQAIAFLSERLLRELLVPAPNNPERTNLSEAARALRLEAARRLSKENETLSASQRTQIRARLQSL